MFSEGTGASSLKLPANEGKAVAFRNNRQAAGSAGPPQARVNLESYAVGCDPDPFVHYNKGFYMSHNTGRGVLAVQDRPNVKNGIRRSLFPATALMIAAGIASILSCQSYIFDQNVEASLQQISEPDSQVKK